MKVDYKLDEINDSIGITFSYMSLFFMFIISCGYGITHIPSAFWQFFLLLQIFSYSISTIESFVVEYKELRIFGIFMDVILIGLYWKFFL